MIGTAPRRAGVHLIDVAADHRGEPARPRASSACGPPGGRPSHCEARPMPTPDAGDALELPPLPEPPSTDPGPLFCATVNGQPTAAYIAHLYLRRTADPHLADEGLRCWFGGGGAWVLRRFAKLCRRLGWSVDARRVDWLVYEYAAVLAKDILAAWNVPFCDLLEWVAEHHRPTPPAVPSVTVAPVVNAPPAGIAERGNSKSALDEAMEALAGSRTGRELVAYLAEQPERCATLAQVARELRKRPRATKRDWESVAQQYRRVQEKLEEANCRAVLQRAQNKLTLLLPDEPTARQK